MRRERGDATGENEPLAPFCRLPAALVREAAVHRGGGVRQTFVEETLIRRHHQARRLGAARVGDHAIGGDDRIAFDAPRSPHQITRLRAPGRTGAPWSTGAGYSPRVRTTEDVGRSDTIGTLTCLRTISSY